MTTFSTPMGEGIVKYTRPIGWPIRRRLCFDSSECVAVWSTHQPRWLADPRHALPLLRVLMPTIQTLFVSQSQHWFVLETSPCGDRVRHFWAFRARLWLMSRGAPADVVAAHFGKWSFQAP